MSSQKYVFVTDDKCSYRLDQLEAYFRALFSMPRVWGVQRTTPGGGRIYDTYDSNIDRQIESTIRYNTHPDYSMSDDQKECTLSLHPFTHPYFMPNTGRAYERDVIVKYIETTYMVGKPLRLENGKQIDPIKDSISLYPHRNLGCIGGDEIKYTPEKVKWPEFREGSQNIISGLVYVINHAEAPDERYDGDSVYRYYCGKKNIVPSDVHYEKIMSDILITGAKLFNVGHVKPGIVFINTEFRDCVIISGCWCGIKFISCRFVNCYIEQFDGIHDWTFRRCQWVDTRFENDLIQAQFDKITKIESS